MKNDKKMTYEECLLCLSGLRAVSPVPITDIKDAPDREKYIPGAKFMYAISKNKSLLGSIEKTLFEIKEPSKEYVEFETGREKILQKYADKDTNGEYIMHSDVGGYGTKTRYQIPGRDDPGSDFRKEMDAYLKENEAVLDEQRRKIDNFREHLSLGSEFEPHKIPEETIPLGLSPEAWDGLIYIIM
jgi:hypothetical protein